jgi:hypothetical protein
MYELLHGYSSLFSLSDHNKHQLSGGADHLVNVWDTTTLRKLCVLDLGRGSSKEDAGVDVVSCCALGRSGTVVAGSYDKSLRVWRLPLQDSVDEWTGGAFLLFVFICFFVFLFFFCFFCFFLFFVFCSLTKRDFLKITNHPFSPIYFFWFFSSLQDQLHAQVEFLLDILAPSFASLCAMHVSLMSVAAAVHLFRQIKKCQLRLIVLIVKRRKRTTT